ncbi:MAG: PDZ domain-containing protein [bacterium]|nr:PDZ domain-containing protein [bacterium]
MNKVKTFFKENYREMITIVILLIILNFPLKYSIMVSGGTINIDDRIKITNSYKSSGSFNLAYVTEVKATIPSYLLSYIIPNWTKVPLSDYQANENETSSDIETRAKVYLEYSKQAAIKNAYELAGKKFNINDNKFYIVYVDAEANTDLKIGDIIKTIDNKAVKEMDEYKEIISNKKIGDKVSLKVDRNGKTIDAYAYIKNINNKKLTGISVINLYDYEVDPEIELTFKNNESGSSGGLMLSLAIYDKLTSEDLTKGKKIVGTGTIDFLGNIGQIDGVEYKLKGAVKQKADIFIAPIGDNYDECIKLKEKYKYDIQIISAEKFDDVIEKLEILE